MSTKFLYALPVVAFALIAAKEGSVYTFDVHLQGDRETVFLDI